MTILVDTILAGIYIFSGTIYEITPQFSGRQNVTGLPGYNKHLFEHPFLLMAFEFVAQALCLVLWYIITGGKVPPRPNQFGIDEDEEDENGVDNPQPIDDDDQMLNAGNGQVQQGNGQVQQGNGQVQQGNGHVQRGDGQAQRGDHDQNGAADDDPILPANHEEEEDERPARQFNNPAWNQRPVDQRKFNVLLFVVPALFDLARYGLLYIAIKLTYDSTYMLIRTAAVLFTVLLRVAFLSKHMAKYMWVSILMVILGLGLIGMTDFVHATPQGYDQYGIAAGCLLMVMSQIMIAMQIVFEEKFMDRHDIHPLRVVGLEGVYGGILALVLLLPFSYVSAGPFSSLKDGHLVDIKDAFLQMKGNWIIALCVVGRVASKPIFYYTGTHFVKNQHDAAKRITIDVHHDLIVWVIALLISWQKWFFPQVFGFLLVPIGMGVYCDIIPLPACFRPPAVPPPAGPLPEQQEQLQLENQEGDGAEECQGGINQMRGAEDGGVRVPMQDPIAAF